VDMVRPQHPVKAPKTPFRRKLFGSPLRYFLVLPSE